MAQVSKSGIFQNKILHSDDFGLRSPPSFREKGECATSIVERVFAVLSLFMKERRRDVTSGAAVWLSSRALPLTTGISHRFGVHIIKDMPRLQLRGERQSGMILDSLQDRFGNGAVAPSDYRAIAEPVDSLARRAAWLRAEREWNACTQMNR